MRDHRFAFVLVVTLGVGTLATSGLAETLRIGVIAPLTGRGAPRGMASGDELRLGGKVSVGSDQQTMQTMYVGALRNGAPVARQNQMSVQRGPIIC